MWVAYNHYGDLIAEADSQNELLRTLAAAGIDDSEVLIGVVTP